MTAVTLLTQADCALCDHAKTVLARLGRDFTLKVTEIDMATNPGRRIALAAGVLFPPGLLLDGEPFGYGRLSERALRKALRHRTDTGDTIINYDV
ncbi:MAG: thioredoxin family protein [Streptosporangiales bacterium]|nr:thioredoxin family protein [Streptosporangiales bacterium]